MNLRKLVLSGLSLLFFSTAIAQFKAEYGNNILSFSPLQINNPGVGFGLSYECDLDKKGIVSLYLPLSFSVANANYYHNYYPYDYPSQKYATGFFMPGLKFYPTGSKGKVKYAVGPNLAIVVGQRPVSVPTILIYPGPTTEYYTMKSRFSLGTMVFNSLNINPTPHLNIGLEMGMGVSYIDKTDGVSTGNMPFLFQLGAKVGYRF